MNLLRLQKDFCTTAKTLADPWHCFTIPSGKIQYIKSRLSSSEIAHLLMLWACGGAEGILIGKIGTVLDKDDKSAKTLTDKLLSGGFLDLERGHLKAPNWCSYKTKNGNERFDLKGMTYSSFPIRLHIDQLKAIIAQDKKSENTSDKIGHCFGLLPHMNVKYSFLCKNPLEKDLDKIVPLSQKEIAEQLGMLEMTVSRMYKQIKQPVVANGRQVYIFGQAKLASGRRVHMPNARLFYTRETDPLLFSWDFSEIGTIKNWDDI